MSLMSRFKYFFREAVDNFLRAFTMAAASMMSVTIAMFLLGLFMVGERALSDLADHLERKVEVTAFLADGIEDSKLAEIISELNTTGLTSGVRHVTKDEAMNTLKKDLGEESDVLGFLDSNPLPASLEIKLKNPLDVERVLEVLKKFIWVEEITYGKGVVKKLVAISRIMRLSGFMLVLLLGVASLVTISSTIRMTIYSRREEIEIMQLVGATNWFIRWPFVIEGFLQGIFGSLASIAILYLGVGYFNSYVGSLMSTPIAPAVSAALAAKLMLIGSVLGTVGALLSVRKCLKVI